MKLALALLMTLASVPAFAGPGQFKAVCSAQGARIIAVYETFHSVADQYSSATVLVEKDGKYEQFEGGVDKANAAVTVQTSNRKIRVKPTGVGTCVVK